MRIILIKIAPPTRCEAVTLADLTGAAQCQKIYKFCVNYGVKVFLLLVANERRLLSVVCECV